MLQREEKPQSWSYVRRKELDDPAAGLVFDYLVAGTYRVTLLEGEGGTFDGDSRTLTVPGETEVRF